MEQPEATIHCFEPDMRAVRREQQLIGVVGGILGPVLLYLGGAQNLVVLFVLGCIGGGTGYGIYALRNRLRAARRIEVSPSALTLTRRRSEIRLPWDSIVNVTEQSHYGQFLTIHTRDRKQPHTFLLEGYTPEQLASIYALIQENRQ